jgi:hypothetical protein
MSKKIITSNMRPFLVRYYASLHATKPCAHGAPKTIEGAKRGGVVALYAFEKHKKAQIIDASSGAVLLTLRKGRHGVIESLGSA